MNKRNVPTRKGSAEGDYYKIPVGVDAKHGYALVDIEFSWLEKFNWTAKTTRSCTYAVRKDTDLNKIVKMQWYVLERKEGLLIDHMNGDGLDNRTNNLRYATKQQNQMNLSIKSTNKTGYKGVSFRKDIKKYTARIRGEGRYLSLGSFTTAIDAAKAYNEAARIHHGDFAKLNPITA